MANPFCATSKFICSVLIFLSAVAQQASSEIFGLCISNPLHSGWHHAVRPLVASCAWVCLIRNQIHCSAFCIPTKAVAQALSHAKSGTEWVTDWLAGWLLGFRCICMKWKDWSAQNSSATRVPTLPFVFFFFSYSFLISNLSETLVYSRYSPQFCYIKIHLRTRDFHEHFIRNK